MKKSYFLLLCIFLLKTASAQQYINFQGKIATSSGPINTTNAIFEFTMPAFPGWTYTVANVSVTNGLYSLAVNLPQGVFDSANYSRDMIVKYNGNKIDTVTLYAPIERDPTVRSYVRDSVFWANIRNKPSIDTSITNEIQVLSINGDTLKLSQNGGSVLLPHVSDTLHSTFINGSLTIFDTAKTIMTSLTQTGTIVVGAVNQAYWQSFKATANGKLRTLKLTVGASGSGSITITFYSGIGNTTLSLANKIFTIPNTTSLQTFDISTLIGLPYLSVTNGQIYTFEVKPSSGNTLSILSDPSNPYAAGISSISNTTDIPFELSIDNSVPSCLTFDANCQVGIGTDVPTAQLDVRGRIKDLTGFVAPPGSIMAYGGKTVPQGWLLCDGRPISRTTYSDLFEAIDIAWGAGNSVSTFNLPDMRGMFLRGVDTSANVGTLNIDPDHAARTSSNTGGNVGNTVGSKQPDIFGTHNHTTPSAYYNHVGAPNGYLKISSGSDYIINNVTINNSGGSETRPKNVYVYYIIKY